MYFNKVLKKFRGDYADGTSDFLSTNDFDGVEMILSPVSANREGLLN